MVPTEGLVGMIVANMWAPFRLFRCVRLGHSRVDVTKDSCGKPNWVRDHGGERVSTQFFNSLVGNRR